MTIEYYRGWFDFTQFEDGRKPVGSGDCLIPDFSLRKPRRITDNGGNTQAAFIVGPLGATPLAVRRPSPAELVRDYYRVCR